MRRLSTIWVVLIGLLVALVLAGVVSFYASSDPDGLEKVAVDKGFDSAATEHDASGSPLADYATKGIDNDRLSGGLAGVIGSVLVLGAAGGLAFVLRRGNQASPGETGGEGSDSMAANAGAKTGER